MAGSIPEDFIREIVDTTNIVTLVDGYLPLKKKGSYHHHKKDISPNGLCPFF